MPIAVRYLVHDVDQAINFYKDVLGFKLEEQDGDTTATMSYRSLTLWLAGPKSAPAQRVPNGEKPMPGGWGRFVIEVEDLEAMIDKLKSAGARFKGSVVFSPQGSQIVIEDPSANMIELFQPK